MTQSTREALKALLEIPIDVIIGNEQTLFQNALDARQGRVILFGSGGLGKKCLAGLRNVGIEPIAFSDNNPATWNKEINNLTVLSPKAAAEKYGSDSLFLITIWSPGKDRSFESIKSQLQGLNCKHILPFVAFFWKYPATNLPYYFMDLPRKIYEEKHAIVNAFDLLSDEYSKVEFLNQLKCRIQLNYHDLSSYKETAYLTRLTLPIMNNETFIDCGAFDGDTARSLADLAPASIEKIICFEPDPSNFEKLRTCISTLDASVRNKIKIHQKGTGKKNERLLFSANGSGASAISGEGDLEVDVVAIDSFLENEKPTFIKMDIEGAEMDTLIGATETIKKHRPILAVSVYHQQDHLWKIPLFLKKLCADYTFSLEPHLNDGIDLVFYAIPNSRHNARENATTT